MSLESTFGDRYHIVRLLGHGGMAAVYLAHQVGIGGFSKKVALKIVHEHLATQRQFTRYFINEARLGGYLLHPNIVQTLDFGEVNGRVFLAMEYVDGPTVQHLLRQCREHGEHIPVDVALQIVIGVCQALDFAHAAVDHQNEPLNMVHRDLKPSNILVSRFGHVKLGDFGVARAECNLDRTLVGGTLKGTVRYMSPEQAWGILDLDYRADLFAVGLVLFELLTMTHLYDAETSEVAIRQAQEADVEHRLEAIPAFSARDEIIRFLKRALAHSPQERFQSAGEMADQLTLVRAKIEDPVSLRAWVGSQVQRAERDPLPSGDETTRSLPKKSPRSTVLLHPDHQHTDTATSGVSSVVTEPRTQPATSGEQEAPLDDAPTETLQLPKSPASEGVPTTIMSLDKTPPRPEKRKQRASEEEPPDVPPSPVAVSTEDRDVTVENRPTLATEPTEPGGDESFGLPTRSESELDAGASKRHGQPRNLDGVTVKLPAVSGRKEKDTEPLNTSANRSTQRPSRLRPRLVMGGAVLVIVAAIWVGTSRRHGITQVVASRHSSNTPVATQTANAATTPEATQQPAGEAVSSQPPDTSPVITTPAPEPPRPLETHSTPGHGKQRFGWLNAASLPASSISVDGRSLDDFPVQNLKVSQGTHDLVFRAEDGRRLEIRLEMKAGARIRCWADFNARRVACR